MSKASGGVALGGMMLGTVVAVLAFSAVAWVYFSWRYGQERLVYRERLLNADDASEWAPTRVDRADASEACDVGVQRLEAEEKLERVGRFARGKVDRFPKGPTTQRARELSKTVKEMQPAMAAFLSAYPCEKNGRVPRSGSENQLSGPLLVRGMMVDAWLNPAAVAHLRSSLWIGRDVQATQGLYEFKEGTLIMDGAYVGLASLLPQGTLDGQLDSLKAQLLTLHGDRGSAQRHWRDGARTLLADLLGPQWDSNPPDPIRARNTLAAMDDVIDSLAKMPNVADQPYPARHEVMRTWLSEHDMGSWNQNFNGFGAAGLEVDELATISETRSNALLLGVALRQYRKRRARCPRALDDLVKTKLLTDLPKDLLADAPFTYDQKSCEVQSVKSPGSGTVVKVSALP